jgi:hypothetical protein
MSNINRLFQQKLRPLPGHSSVNLSHTEYYLFKDEQMISDERNAGYESSLSSNQVVTQKLL